MKEDFFTSSTKLVNKDDVDYGAMLERRRRAFLDASAAKPFFWYSALTAALLLALMFAYGVRVMDEKRKLWRAAEILNDVWNDAQYARMTAEKAIDRHNSHMEECNRVIEAQLSGRPSPAALATTDANNELTRVRSELDSVDSDRILVGGPSVGKSRDRSIDNLPCATEKARSSSAPCGTSRCCSKSSVPDSLQAISSTNSCSSINRSARGKHSITGCGACWLMD
jgi:hypothetical protein